MKRRLAIIMAALLIAAMAGCQQSGTSTPADSSTVQSSADSSVAESAESEISEAESSVVSEETSTESSGEKSEASKTESSDKSSKTESSRSKTEESSKKETSKAESSKTETSKTESSKSESSKAEEPKVTGINIDMSSLSLTSGTSYELNAYILWSNGTSSYNGITWSSSNSSVASVNSTGYVTAKSAGTATITASYGSYSKSCTVTVKAAQVSQHSQPSGGGSSGGNGGSTSKPSGGGNSGGGSSNNGGSSGNGGSSQTTTPSTPSKPQIWDDDMSWQTRLNKVTSPEGRTFYECTDLVDVINKYRRQNGLKEVSWGSYDFDYNIMVQRGQELKNKNNRRHNLIEAGLDDNFDENFKPREKYNHVSDAQWNKDTLVALDWWLDNPGSGHGDGSANILSHISCYDLDDWIGGLKTESPSHWHHIVKENAEEMYAVFYYDATYHSYSFAIVIGISTAHDL